MLRRVVIVAASGALALDPVAAEFPSLTLERREAAPPDVALLDADALFAGGARGWQIDRALDGAAALALAARDTGDAVATLTRLQRLCDRRNAASATAGFARALARHRALHDLERPLVRADYDHALDAWQWLLRLDGDASAAAQLAALLHDVERLGSEADARLEQRAPDYDRYKRAHARRGAELVRALLAPLPLDPVTVERAAALVAAHDQPAAADAPAELTLVNDADALSFFSLNAGGYLDYFGPAQARKKIAWTLARLSPRGRQRLAGVRLRDDVRALVPRKEAA
jgi:hypothetical protein